MQLLRKKHLQKKASIQKLSAFNVLVNKIQHVKLGSYKCL